MAPALKLWIGLTLGGLAVVSVAMLPPSVTPVTMRPGRLPEEVRASSLQSDVRRTSSLIRMIRWMDSLPALAVATAENGLAVHGDPGLVDGQQLEAIRSALLTELARLPRRDGRAVLGFFVQPSTFAAELSGYTDTRPAYELFAGHEGDTPYCLVVQRRHTRLSMVQLDIWHDVGGDSRSNLLQACRLVAAYGLPGPAIRAWLAQGGYRYAERAGQGKDTNVPIERYRDRWGRSAVFFGYGTLAPERCLSGQADACAGLLLHGTEDRLFALDETTGAAFRQSIGATLAPSGTPLLGDAARYLLSDLEYEYGPDAFREFWTSERDVGAAFEVAFGEPLGDWAVRWTSTHLGLERYGPGIPKGAWLGTVVLLLLGAWAGGLWHRRRAVA